MKPVNDKKSNNSSQSSSQTIYIIIAGFLVVAAIILVVTYVALKNTTPKVTKVPVDIVTDKGKDKEETKKELQIFDNSNERPIAVMIDNAIGDANHAGLQESFLNYEIIVEGGITRIMALYKDKDVNLIGPIRSARHYFLDYALESDAIYVHYGWSPYAEDDITKLKIDNVNGLTDSSPFRRDTKSIAPHNVFTRMSYLKSFIDTTGSEVELSQEEGTPRTMKSLDWKLLHYSTEEIMLNDKNPSAKVANEVIIPYSATEVRKYKYSDSDKYYFRISNDKAEYDRKSGEQLHYKNIIIQRVKNTTLDDIGRQALETTGTGTGFYITNGYCLPINWSKATRESKTIYTYEDGAEIIVNDGNTFIQIVPLYSNIAFN